MLHYRSNLLENLCVTENKNLCASFSKRLGSTSMKWHTLTRTGMTDGITLSQLCSHLLCLTET